MKEWEICEKFKAAAERIGWKVYPEVGGWDLLLVWQGIPEDLERYKQRGLKIRTQDLRPGDQLAVEAKTRANVTALAQCVKRLGSEKRPRRKGPDFAAILAPKISGDFRYIACRHGLTTFDESHFEARQPIIVTDSQRRQHKEKLWTPPVVPDIAGGQSSPSPLTKWRVKALEICALLRARGHVTTADFKALDISYRRWVDYRWIVQDGKIGRRNKYVIGDDSTDSFPDKGWEGERDAIIGDASGYLFDELEKCEEEEL